MKYVFINCKEAPFVDMIINGTKLFETRSKDVLKGIKDFERFTIVETGKGKPQKRCLAFIVARGAPDADVWPWYRARSEIIGTSYDSRKPKFVYELIVEATNEGSREIDTSTLIHHGYSWAED